MNDADATTRLRIALVKRRYSLAHGGSERYCVKLARGLMEAGHEVTVLGETIDADLHGEVKFIPVPVMQWSSSAKNRSFAVNAREIARKRSFDVVYGLGRALGLDAVRVTERLQSHWVRIYYRNPMRKAWEQFNPRHRTLINLERSIYEAASTRRIILQSRLDRQLLFDYYRVPPEKTRIIYNGVDLDTFHPGVSAAREEVRSELNISNDKRLLLFASMDFEGKGLATILEAMFRTDDPSLHLLVLGKGPVAKFARQADELGIAGSVTFAGRRSGIERYYGAADLFVLPTEYEPFPNVNLEAMACGVPVITTRTNGSADVMEDGTNGYLIPTRDSVDELTAALSRHVSLPESDERKMRAQCRLTAERFPMSLNLSQTIEMFHDVVREKHCA